MDSQPNKSFPAQGIKEEIIDAGVIEGGEMTAYRDLEVKPPSHREATARWLAIILVLIFGGSALLHYFTLAFFIHSGKMEAIDKLGTFFNSWLPAITALVGAATTYYFTKDQR